MKVTIPILLLILMSLWITEAVAQTLNLQPPTKVTVTPGDRSITVTWQPPILDAGDRAVIYYEVNTNNGGNWRPPGEEDARFYTIEEVNGVDLENGTQYTVRIRVTYDSTGLTPPIIDNAVTSWIPVTPMIPPPTGLIVTVDDRKVTLRWTAPPVRAPITGYEYSQDGGSTWTPTGSTSTTHTVTGLENEISYTFSVRAVRDGASDERNGRASSNSAIVRFDPPPPPNRIIRYDCPVGWQRTDRLGGPTQRVLIYEVNLEMDLHNRISIYKPDSVAIYVHPDEALENLEGWKLQVAVPYNLHRDYLLTAENAVVVDSTIEGVEGGFAFIESPAENPFPMVAMGFTGALVPGFDYRLYDDTGRKVDFGIACYKQGGIFQALKEMEDPRVLRKVLLETLDWDVPYIRSEWMVPTPAPAAPSLVKKTVVGTWADLKKQ